MVTVMRKLGTVTSIFVMLILALTLVKSTTAQTPSENMKTFFDSTIPGIKIQVNATAETRPTENITVMLSMKGLGDVYIEYFNLSIFGFLNGTYKVIMANITDNNFSLKNILKEYNCTFKVPEQVWDVTYGEILLTYRAVLGGLELRFPQLTYGFTMTHVENVYLKKLENDLKSWIKSYQQLNNTYWQLNSTFEQLQQNYTELLQNYTALQGSLNELGNTRMAVGILAVTTVFFVATTLYLVMRKPKESW